jgi:multidrug resistance efflux pump
MPIRGRDLMLRKSPDQRRPPRASRVLLSVVAVLSLLELAGFASSYLLYSRHYVSTDNAQVDGDLTRINAPNTGTVTQWSVGQGDPVRRNQVVGRIQAGGSGAQPGRPVRAPGDGIIAVDDAVQGAYVSAGTELAIAVAPGSIYVTARVEDTEIAGVRPGAAVDIGVDAYPDIPVTGVVSFTQAASAGSFSDLPPPGTADPSNPQRVDQYVPVRIALTSTGGVVLRPGMNVTVHIHKQ